MKPFPPNEEVRSFVFLSLLLALAAGVAIGVSRCGSGQGAEHVVLAEEEVRRAERGHAQAQAETAQPDVGRPELFPFDPNLADSLTLRRLGLREWQVRNLLKYRSKGGRWRSPDDLRRLYGLSTEDFERLRPYIRIAPETPRAEAPAGAYPRYGTPKGEKPAFEKQEKYAEGTVVPLNRADTAQLKRIPGIGSHYARKIVAYRERLGGFVSVRQVEEIEGLPPGVSRWFSVEENPEPKRLRINRASFKELVRHPYLSYEQTKDIVNHVRSYGPLRSWQDLRLYPGFSEADFVRLAPYFTFD